MPVSPIVWDSGSFVEKISNPSDQFLIDNVEPSGSDILKIGDQATSTIYVGNNNIKTYVSGVLSASLFSASSISSSVFYGDGQYLNNCVINLNLFTSSIVQSSVTGTFLETLHLSTSLSSSSFYRIDWYSEISMVSAQTSIGASVRLYSASLTQTLGEISYNTANVGYITFAGYDIKNIVSGSYKIVMSLSSSSGRIVVMKNEKLSILKLN